ncbi:PAS domain S-box protein [Mycobacterium sp. PS03-16]|uniref:PP2C family protein-serine/threonine phosphatase n=1 Tax=Mycobacterium sp. PS03-16 TaxID=2559611 RepID=UPI0010740F90|nr:SpoIIE family protein phosphatase [Mycobacterium sp. PS03-16]TFV56103.1 PAS domain S-box protein [Mycobacterium sp. PS03-16]
MTADDLFEHAPCGYAVVGPDRRIVQANATLAGWLGQDRGRLVGSRFTDLLAVGSRIHFETHFAPLLLARHALSGVAVDLITADGGRMPVFLAANVRATADGRPEVFRFTFDDATDRRSYERELLMAQQRAEEQRRRAEALAGTLQRSLLPPSLSPPPGIEASALFHPASVDDVAGDFYDLFPLSPDCWGFFLGDVCGKGPKAAAITSLTRYTLRAAAVFDDDPVAVLQNLNAILHDEFRRDSSSFCTVIFGVLSRNGTDFDVHLASGGHPPPILLRGDGRAGQLDTVGGQAVGIFAAPRFRTVKLRLSAGDVLMVHSDGLTEARIDGGAGRLDETGLLDFAGHHAPNTPAGIVAALEDLLARLGAGVEDDVAVLAFGPPATP